MEVGDQIMNYRGSFVKNSAPVLQGSSDNSNNFLCLNYSKAHSSSCKAPVKSDIEVLITFSGFLPFTLKWK